MILSFSNTSKTHVMQAGTHRGNGQQQTICSHRHFTGVSTLHAHIHRRSRGNATVVNWALLNPSFKLLETFSIIWIFPGKIKQTQIIATRPICHVCFSVTTCCQFWRENLLPWLPNCQVAKFSAQAQSVEFSNQLLVFDGQENPFLKALYQDVGETRRAETVLTRHCRL